MPSAAATITKLMVSRRYAGYLRASTTKQGEKELGVEAKREALRRNLVSHHGDEIAEFADRWPTPRPRVERALIVQQTNEVRARAMADGTRFGRKPKLSKHQAREVLKRVAAGEPMRQIALSYNVDHSTITRLKARYAAEV